MTDADLPLHHVHVEPEEATDGPAPAVFVLHGRGSHEEDLLPIAQELPDDYHVVSFRAPGDLRGGYTWYELDLSAGGLEASQPDPTAFRRSLDALQDAIPRAVDAYDLDASRLGLLGFSQGAITSLALLLEDPDDYAWVVGLHGYLAESHADLAPDGLADKPIFLAGGTADQIIPIERVERAAASLEEKGCAVEFNAYDAPHGVGQEELEDLVDFVERNG